MSKNNGKKSSRAGEALSQHIASTVRELSDNLSQEKQNTISINSNKLHEDMVSWIRGDDKTIADSIESVVLEMALRVLLDEQVIQIMPVVALLDLVAMADLRLENYIVYNTTYSDRSE